MSIILDSLKDRLEHKAYQPHEAIACAHMVEWHRHVRDSTGENRLVHQAMIAAYWSWSKGTRPYSI